jgi:hypothetical protein
VGEARIRRSNYGVRPSVHASRCAASRLCGVRANGYRAPVARKKLPPVAREDAKTVGALLRNLRRAAGYRAVQDAASASGFPAARQTIYAYERGGLTPSLQQFLDLVEFYALHPTKSDGVKPEEDLRAQAVAAVARAITLPAYHVRRAQDLMERLQPSLAPGRRAAG